MTLPQNVQDDIKNAIETKVGPARPCAICGSESSYIGADLALVEQIGDVVAAATSKPKMAAHAVLICGNCGNTSFLSLEVLGLAHLVPGDMRS